MLDTIIVDDEPLAHDVILNYLDGLSFINVREQFYSAVDALNYFHDNSVDLIFLDLNMPKLKGLELLRLLPNQPLVIITSAHKDYALESYELDVVDYLLKPFRFERFLKAVHKAQDIYKLKNPSSPTNKIAFEKSPAPPPQLLIKVDRKQVPINLDAIFYIEAYGNFVKIWTLNECYMTARTLSSLEQELAAFGFIRTHKSYIINSTYIQSFTSSKLMLTNRCELPVGKQYKHQLNNLNSG